MFEQKTFDGPDSEQHLWVSGATIEMGPMSPSMKEGSVTTAGSIKSLEEAHVKH
jgi:hypothetical protein